ncbi:MAG TPA: FHA domain-containing protein, partial [Solirubrobacterales bacterium]|nr:FHA domain-containing protein [Solirubrobacterales bacterium]
MRSGGADRLVTLSGELTIGRSVDGDGGLPDDRKISRRHARFLLDPGGGLAIEDLRSANGTAVNGVALEPGSPRDVGPGDLITAGDTVIEVLEQAGERASAAADRPRPAPNPGEVATPVEQAGSPSSAATPATPGEPAESASAPVSGEVLHDGRRVAIAAAGLAIGSDPGCEIVIEARTVAGRHALVKERDGRHYLADLGAGPGTLLNGELLRGESR